MIGTLAHGAILVSLAVVAFGMFFIPFAIKRDRRDWVALAYSAVYTNFLLITVATVAMVWALVTHDFSLSYVAQVGSKATPLFYTIISLWGALEGSILFWAWVLAMYAAAVVWINADRPGNLVPYAAAALLGISLFFGILLVGPADPFKPVFPVPLDDSQTNPPAQQLNRGDVDRLRQSTWEAYAA